MKGKPKPAKKAGPSETARDAGCSKSQAHKLLGRGLSKEEIITRTAERKARAEARAGVGNNHVNGAPTNGFPVTPWPTFAQSEARKEHLLAELRDLQLMRERGELIPASYVRIWAGRFLVEAKDILLAGPSELQDVLAAECDPLRINTILRGWVERAFDRFHKCDGIWRTPPEAA
jgi:hypothetical protein